MTSSLQKHLADYVGSATVVTGLLVAALAAVVLLHLVQTAVAGFIPAPSASAVQAAVKAPHASIPALS